MVVGIVFDRPHGIAAGPSVRAFVVICATRLSLSSGHEQAISVRGLCPPHAFQGASTGGHTVGDAPDRAQAAVDWCKTHRDQRYTVSLCGVGHTLDIRRGNWPWSGPGQAVVGMPWQAAQRRGCMAQLTSGARLVTTHAPGVAQMCSRWRSVDGCREETIGGRAELLQHLRDPGLTGSTAYHSSNRPQRHHTAFSGQIQMRLNLYRLCTAGMNITAKLTQHLIAKGWSTCCALPNVASTERGTPTPFRIPG